MCEAAYENYTENPEAFVKFLEEAEKPLYKGCKRYTRLSALVRLFNTKARHGMTDALFSDLLTDFGDMLPDDHNLPSSMYEAKKTLSCLSLTHEKIHACSNDCVLYRKQYKDIVSCPRCGLSRWKVTKNNVEKKGVPAKVVWYFPPNPRFKCMFKSLETSKNLTWHADSPRIAGQLRHPVDSPSWKLVDHMWPEFACEERNLRLALAADGINPHSNLSSRYSCWPIMLVTYNLPPNMCMKRKFIMLTMLISGPKQPGNDIDVYLEILIEDLQQLWEGVDGVYDAYRTQSFTLKAVLLWTINDFPAYGNLSGCTTHGYYACPVCGEDTHAKHLENGRKMSFAGHRRFLQRFHPYRKQLKEFDGSEELRESVRPLSGLKLFDKLTDIAWGGYGKKKKVKRSMKKNSQDETMECNFKKCWKKKYHWILSIVNEERDTVYMLDSMGNQNRHEDWKNIVCNGVRKYNASVGVTRAPAFKQLKGNLKQHGSVECGYCVMLYMRSIVRCEDPQLETMFAGNKKKLYYTQSEYDEVRSEWSEFVYPYIQSSS